MEVLPEFKLHQPTSLAEALDVRDAVDDARYISGGTDLMANLRRGLTPTENLIDLTGVAELQSLTVDGDGLHIGAAVTLAEIAANADIQQKVPALAMAANEVAGPTHREAATVGGNVCLDTRCFFYNQSQWWRDSNDGCMKYEGTICHVVPTSKRCYAAYSGDVAPALLVLNAQVDIAGPAGTRTIPIADLFNDDGIDYLTLAEGEIVTAIHVPIDAGKHSAYAKLRIRGSIDFPLAGIALNLSLVDGNVQSIQAAITGTKSIPVAISGLDVFVGSSFDDDDAEAFAKLVQKQIAPLHTTTTQPQYRRRAVTAMARKLAVDLKAAASG